MCNEWFPPKASYKLNRMIILSDADVAEFKALVKQETGKDITDDEARVQATNLIHLVAAVTKKNPSLTNPS